MPREILVKGKEKTQAKAREIFPSLSPENLKKVEDCDSIIIEESLFKDPGPDYTKFTFYKKAEQVAVFRSEGY